jgi:high mobility group protein B1
MPSQGSKKRGRPRIKPLFAMHKPKAPVSSYLLYLHENKADIAARHKVTNISEVTKAASEEWKKMTEFDKQRYCKKS